MGNLTDIQIKGWVRAGAPIARSDGGGLTFTLSSKGAAAWALRYRHSGRARELTLGRYPDISLVKARELATTRRAEVQQGVDVARAKQKAIMERSQAKTVRELASDYMDKAAPRLAVGTFAQRQHHIDHFINPKIGGLPAREVTTGDVVDLIEGVGKHSRSVAELVFTAISEMFKHGIARHAVSHNPCGGITVSAICGPAPPQRQRLMLTADELKVLLAHLGVLGAQNALAVKIMLATCVRIGELARAEWADIDFEKQEWRIPDANSKSGKGFIVPVVPVVAEWFKELRPLAMGSRYVLPARQARRRTSAGGDIYYEKRALNAVVQRLCDKLESKVRRFTPHDLRSTARSHLAALGVNVIVAERCLNHTLGGLVAVYDQHDYLPERRAALLLWANQLLNWAC